MRAKLKIETITQSIYGDQIKMVAVCPDKFTDGGLSEDNTFAKFTPSATLDITVQNPALVGAFKPGQTFYVDFTSAS